MYCYFPRVKQILDLVIFQLSAVVICDELNLSLDLKLLRNTVSEDFGTQNVINRM